MNLFLTIPGLSDLQPIAWLLLLIALYVGGKRRYERQQKHGIGPARADHMPPSYVAFGVFAFLRFAGALVARLLLKQDALQPGNQPHAMYLGLLWLIQSAAILSLLFIVGALLENSLAGDADVARAAKAIYRWSAGILVCIAITSHLPDVGAESLQLWLAQTRLSLLICVAGGELCLLVLLLGRHRQLGLSLRSRPVGIALGLTVCSVFDITRAFSLQAAAVHALELRSWAAFGTLFVIGSWMLYVILPEPPRRAMALTNSEQWMNWKQVSQRLSDKRPVAPAEGFMSGVEVIVDSVLEKHHIAPPLK